MDGDETSSKPSRWRRRLGRALWMGAACAVVMLVLLQAEALQRWAFRAGIKTALGAEAVVRGIAFPDFGVLRVGELTLGDPGMPPVVRLSGLSIEYTPRGTDGRYLKRVSVDDLSLTLDERRPGQRNYAFLQRLTKGPASNGDSMRFTPPEIDIRTLSIQVRRADWSVRGAGLSLNATVSAMDHLSFVLKSDHLDAEWTTAMLPEPVSSTGAVELLGERTSRGMDLHAALRLPEVGRFDGDAHLGMGPAGLDFELSAVDTELAESFIAALASDRLGTPLRFETLRIPGIELSGRYGPSGITLNTAEFNADVEGLRVGEDEALLYAGRLGIEGRRAEEDPAAMDFVLTLADGQQARLRARFAGGRPPLQARVDGWSREALMAAMPEAWRDTIVPWLGGIRGLDADLTADPGGVEGRVILRWNLPGEAAPTMEGTWSMASGEGRLVAQGLDLSLSRSPGKPPRVRIVLEALPVARWYQGLTGVPMPGDLQGLVTGEAVATRKQDGAYAFRSALSTEVLHAMGADLPAGTTLTMTLASTASSDLRHWQGNTATAKLADAATLFLAETYLTTSPLRLTSQVSATADLPALGTLLNQGEWRGEAKLDGKLTLAEGVLSGPITVMGETLGYGDYFTPYGEAISLRADVRYHLAQGTAGASDVRLQLGEGTRATVKRLRYLDGTVKLDTPALETDLQPAVSKGYLDRVDGHATLDMDQLVVSSGSLTGKGILRATIARAVLPGGVAVIEGGDVKADLSLANALNATGSLGLDALLAGGLTVRRITAKATAEENVLHLRDIKGKAAGGTIQGNITVPLLEPAPSITVDMTVEDADLAALCDELDLTDVRLTGKARGEIHLEYASDGLRALDADLSCTKDFTVNRDLIERALLAQFVQDAIGKGLTRRARRIIGDAPQRPFDSATATLRYDADTRRMVGTLTLKSRLLDLPIEVRVDLEAILEVLRLKQRGLLGEFGDSAMDGVE